ncbi:hypothetical protein [Deinococcus sp.]|uniref:hypothetical protein n=1 Tax=Deinococcus sp. TaxID=47478 RepID=UPI0025BC2EE9|nr:hypothetical protein [Deinococcus sp.]
MTDRNRLSVTQTAPPVVVVVNQKSVILGLILTFLFGGLGMLYATIVGGIVMIILSSIVGLMTGGLGLVVLWPIQMIWTYLAIKNHNKGQARAVARAIR